MTTDWMDGYVVGLDYTSGYYPQLNPLRARLALLNANIVAPVVNAACELGYGKGLSANMHAAASVTQWCGTDFISAQAGFAQEMATASGADARFFDQSFAEFCARTDLPDFDFIGLHGVWTWISDENRTIIVDFLRRKLKVGGVVFFGYNALPAFAAMMPVRDVIAGYADSMVAPGRGLAIRLDASLDFTEKLLAHSPRFLQTYPLLADQLREIRKDDQRYIAHEYLNRNWDPMSFLRMAEWLAPAKLDYACSADYFDTLDELNLGPEQQALLKEVPDPMLRESVRDIMVNRSFRKDYWVKGVRRLTPREKAAALSSQQFILIRHRNRAPVKAAGTLREFEIPQSICEPILDVLADHRPKTLGQIEQAVEHTGINSSQVTEVVLTLSENAILSPVQDDTVIRAARKQTDRLNAFLCDKAHLGVESCMLASPVIGCGLWFGPSLMQFFMHAIFHKKERAADLAAHVLPMLGAAGIGILDEGRVLESPNERLAKVTAEAAFFLERDLPMLKALQIA